MSVKLLQHWPNLLADRCVHAARWDRLVNELQGCCECNRIDIDFNDLSVWCDRYVPEWRRTFGEARHKKLIEFYCSYRVLNIEAKDTLMDVAGGVYGYLQHTAASRRILQDRVVAQGTRAALGSGVEYVCSGAGAIPLQDRSVDKISAHHSFEHFQGNEDSRFIDEVQRLLSPGGICCIVPFLLSSRHYEITDKLTFRQKYDPGSHRLIDPTASLPGCAFSGHYARVYDVRAFCNRILSRIDTTRFAVFLSALEMNGVAVPDLTLPCHRGVAAVNYPYRSLVIRRLA